MSKKALGKRELEVLALVCQGMSDKEIADALSISRSTVRTHLLSIRRKLGGVPNRTALALLGYTLLKDWKSGSSGQKEFPVIRRSGLPYSSPLLSSREKEVMRLLQRGARNKEIAAALGISENTVKIHVRRIMEKLDVDNRTQIAVLAPRFLDESGAT